MSEPFWDFSVTERAIVSQLRATVGSAQGWARQVGTRTELAAVPETAQTVPAVVVIYDGHAVRSADEYASTLIQRWWVVLAVSNASQGPEAAPRNAEAGPRLGELQQLLHGWTPAGSVTPLIPTSPPRPWYSPSGKFAYFALGFSHDSYQCAVGA